MSHHREAPDVGAEDGVEAALLDADRAVQGQASFSCVCGDGTVPSVAVGLSQH